jgi:dienelactone hydrolase
MKKWLWVLGFFLTGTAQAALKTEVVEYKHGDKVLEGYFAYDDALKGPRPGILVVHEWKGHGPYVRSRAEQLAGLGYAAFAIDMYGKGVRAKDHDEAAKLSGVYRSNRQLMRSRAAAGLDVLRKRPEVDPKKMAAIGYCFGGTTVLEMARGAADVLGVASFHGGLDSPAADQTKNVSAKILVLQGADDKFTLEGVPAFQEEMRRANADWQMNIYGGAVHSFTVAEAGNDPSKGMAYNEKADRRSWEDLKDFLTEIFGQ